VASALIGATLAAGIPKPQLFRLPDGGVQIEWQAGPVELKVEIEADRQGLVFACDDEQSGQPLDGQLPDDLGILKVAFARLYAQT
jgi:hypothetical protein